MSGLLPCRTSVQIEEYTDGFMISGILVNHWSAGRSVLSNSVPHFLHLGTSG